MLEAKTIICFCLRRIVLVLLLCELIEFALATQYVVSNSFATSTCQNFQCPNILTAIQSVATGDEIILEPGVYEGSNNTGFEPSKVYGGTNKSYNFRSVSISGNGDASSVIVQGGIFNTRFLQVIDGSFSTIRNITFQNFALPTVSSYVMSELGILGVNAVGGTFAVTNSTLVVFENLNFYNNSALFGAGISAVGSSLKIYNCEFINNFAGYHGGALSVGQTDILVSSSRFINNTASSIRQQLTASGGAIFSVGVSTNHTKVVDSIFINNTADHNGGAVSLEPGTNIPQFTSGTVYFKQCQFVGNVATGVGSCLSTTSCITSGGAIYVTSANFSVVGSYFEQNRAYTTSTIDLAEGGAIFSTNLLGSKGTARSMSRISHSTFVKNSAWGYGGAIYFDKQRFQITKSTFESNEVLSADQLFCDTPAAGGAIYVSYSNSDLNSITSTNFTQNNAITGWGGAVFATENSALHLSHVMFTNNFAISSYTNAALGGAIMITGQCSLHIEDCGFEGNAAVPLIYLSPMTYSGGGGALFAQSSDVTIHRSFFTRNLAFTGQFDGGSTGGGIVLEDCYPAIVEQSRFVQNGAIGFMGKSSYASCGTGGAIYAKFSSASINNSTFLQNWASAGGKQNSIGGGVAIYFDYASVESAVHGVQLMQSLFENNTAFGQICSQLQAGSGGAIGVVGASRPPLIIGNVTFSQNSALGSPATKGLSGLTADGGAISAGLSSNVSVFGSQFYHNAAFFGTGSDFSSIAGEDDDENLVSFEDVVFQTADANTLIERVNYLSTVSSYLCETVQNLIDNMRQKFTVTSSKVNSAKKPQVGNHLHHRHHHQHHHQHQRILDEEYTVIEDYGIHVSVPTDPSSKKPSLVHLFDETIEVNSDEIIEWRVDNENSSLSIDEDGLIKVIKRYFEAEQRILTGDDYSSNKDKQKNSVSSTAQILSKSLNFLDSRSQSLENSIKKDNLKWSSKKPRNFGPLLETIENIRENSFSFMNDDRRLSTSDFTISGDIVDNFVGSLPDLITTRGRTTFVNPTIIGEYHIFVGDYNAFLLARQGLLDSSNDYYKSYLSFIGTINVDNLTLTAINAEVYSDAIDAKDHQNLHLSRLNVFNSSILFTSNIIVKGQSLLLDSLFQGEAGNFVSLPINAKPNITFQSDIITGYSLPEIFGYEESWRPALHEFKNRMHNTSNQSYSSIQRYRGCELYIEGRMIVDSPYHAVNVYLGSTALTDKYFNYFSDSQMYFENNATMTIHKSGALVLLTNTLVQTDNANAVAMFNFGNVALLGTTVSLVYQTGRNPAQLKSIAHSGSLGSKLTVFGNYFQAASGTMTIYLNYSYQVQPVVYLANNRTFSGSVFVDFYGVDPTEPDSKFCPGLQLGSDPSSFTVVSFLKTDFSGLLDVHPKYLATKPAKIDSIPGLQFTAKVENLHIDALNASVHNQVIEVQNIACENIFAFYSGVSAAVPTGSKYPCYICVQNSSCSLCQDETGAQSCVESSLCVAPYTQKFTGDCCGECKTGGTCVPTTSDFSSFECDYSCSWFYAEQSPGCKEISTAGMVVIFIGCALFIGVLGIYFMYQRTEKQKEQVLEELREGILRHTLTANNDYIQDMQQALILNDVFVNYDELTIEGKVGEGSFGVVHKASFRGAQVAVKQMRSMFLEITNKEIEEFRKEAYMMSRLRHPNIVLVMGITLVDMEPVQPKSRTLQSVMDSEIPGNNDKDKDKKKPPKPQKTVCIITEFLEQGSLSDILYGPTRLPPEIFTYELTLTIALQAARGMLYLHSHQPPICHRDLKSSNLVVDDHWVVKVTDFGMSRIVPERVQDEDKGVGEDDRESLGGGSIAEISETNPGPILVTGSSRIASRSSANTNGVQTLQTGQTHMTGAPNLEMTSNLGTTAWCAPEVLTSSSRARYSIKVDVYSYGMVLWELLEKKRPFEEYSSRFDIMDAVKAGKRPAINENCPPTYKALIKRCWQTEPSRRPTFNYIVRYLKDELARVKRSKAVNQSSGGSGGQFSNFPRPGSVSALIRQSFSGNPPGGSNSTENQPRPSLSLLGRFSMSAQNRADSISHQSTTAVLGAINNPLQSVVHVADLESGDLREEDVGMSPVASVNNTSMSYLEERRQTELAAEKTAAATVRGTNNTGLGTTNPSHRESVRNLPENRTPLVAAVDRSLSYLTESPAISSQHFRPYQKYGVPHQNNWRDKYVMQFSGWNSANPDSGLPPQSRPLIGASPGMSYSPSTASDTVRQGRPLSSPSRQMASPANYPRRFGPSMGPNAQYRPEPSSQAQSPSNVSPIETITETSNHDQAVFAMDDEQNQSGES